MSSPLSALMRPVLCSRRGTRVTSMVFTASISAAHRPVSYTHLDVYKRQVAGLLGHAQPSTTLDIYSHTFDKNKKLAQQKLAEAMGL